MSRWITDSPIDTNALLAETADDACGALIVFEGTVRNHNEGRPVGSMTYEAHIELAENALCELETEVTQNFDVQQCRIQHRIGKLKLSETSVVIVVRGHHRASTFQASQYAIDQLKQRAAIWKEEQYIDGDSKYLDGTPLLNKEQS